MRTIQLGKGVEVDVAVGRQRELFIAHIQAPARIQASSHIQAAATQMAGKAGQSKGSVVATVLIAPATM